MKGPATRPAWRSVAGFARSLLGRHRPFQPPKVTAILTERCHLKCQFCELWRAPDPGAATDDWIRFFARNPFLRWVNLSGGEVFARERFADLLAGIVDALPDLALLDFPTAGQRPDQAEAAVDQLLASRVPRILVTVSIDGGPDLHDELRGVPGSFERALECFRRLRKRRDRRFDVAVGCTLTRRAREQVETLSDALRAGIPGLSEAELHFNLAHHSPHYYKNTGYRDLPDQEACEVLEARPLRPSAVGWAEWVYARLARRALAEGFPPMGCEALRKTVFVAPDLTVHPCSIWDRPLGNLCDFDLSLEALLATADARAARTTIERQACPGCFSPCEAIPAILAHPLRSTAAALAARGPQRNGS